MKTLVRFSFVVALLSLSRTAFAATDADILSVRVKELWVSPSSACVNPVKVLDSGTTPFSYVDFLINPTIESGLVPNGTYHCVALRISDMVNFSPAANDGAACLETVTSAWDFFRADSAPGGVPDISVCPDSTVVLGNGTLSPGINVEDRPCLYFSTAGNASFDGYTPATPLPMAAPLQISTDGQITLVYDARGKVLDDGVNGCVIQGATFRVR